MGFLNLFKKNGDTFSISEEEIEDFYKTHPRGKDLTELKSYTERAFNGESKFIYSKKCYPLCPVCGEEFKNKEALFSHLRNNKREFMTLPEKFDYKFEYAKSFGAGSGRVTLMTFGNVHLQFDLKDDWCWVINTTLNPKQAIVRIDYNTDKIKSLIDLELLKHRIFLELEEEKYKEWEKSKTKENRRESTFPQKLRFEILKRDNFTCQYCGRKSPEVELEVDHIEPYSKTKNNNPENLITSCKDCNQGKRTKEII